MTNGHRFMTDARSVLLCVAVLTAPVLAAAQEPGTVVAADSRVQGRTYRFAATGQEVPYALFVPSTYDRARPAPLIIGLHGLGRPYDWLMGYDGMIDFAERGGFVMATPLGYHPRGWYGSRGPAIPAGVTATDGQPPLPANLGELSEQDVMNVLDLVRKEFAIDPARIYLWGHSMGGAGTYHLAAKYPDIWAGLAVAAPAPQRELSPDRLEAFQHVPILVLHGDEDRTVPVAGTREWVRRMAALGMQHVYVEVKGGDHTNFIARDRAMLSKVFSFFDIVRKSP
jgi:predicted peptidase